MLREIYSIVIIGVLFIIGYSSHQKLVAINALQQQPKQQQHAKEEELHPSLLVDTKYWLGNTELGERDNWRNGIKPCTLQETIRLDEQSAISMSDYMDALGGPIQADIRDLSLPTNGILLFEEDTLGESGDPIDSLFIQYLNESGDCFDSSQVRIESDSQQQQTRLFNFQPDPDLMSWFNPENWASALNENDIRDWIPDSHRIPCSEDAVVFGSRQVALGPTVEANERSTILSFKVNFEPSQLAEFRDLADIVVNNIRVSKLKIGDVSYNQHEFEQLINSEQYENILFQFNSNRSVLKPEDGFAHPSESLLTIDKSSIRSIDSESHDFCLDEAGCLCGNENTNIMRIICSFNHPLQEAEQPCHDPIPSAGYCNKICATIITIGMDPTRFSEKFVSNIIYKMLSDGEVSNYFSDSVFTGARRTHDNKYEITFRNVPTTTTSGSENDSGGANLNYETNLGKEREFAKLVYEKLNNGATKSFYGIKSLSIRSSVDWRRNNRGSIFWISYFVLSLVAISIFVIQDYLDIRGCTGASNVTERDSINRWFVHTLRRLNRLMGGSGGLTDEGDEFSDSFVGCTDPVDSSLETNGTRTTSQIPLVDLDSVT